jgi:hypothetical protein
VIEPCFAEEFSETHLELLSQLTESIGIVLNTIETTTRTEELLSQSQSLAGELKIQQEELRSTNDELQDKALLLVKPEGRSGSKRTMKWKMHAAHWKKKQSSSPLLRNTNRNSLRTCRMSSHSPQQLTHSRAAALRKCRREPERQTDQVCENDPFMR